MLFPQCRRAGRIAGLVVAILAVAPSLLDAQAVERITGRVVDPSGGALPGAEITLTDRATGAMRRTTSDAGGTFVLRAAPGRYDLHVRLEGLTALRREVTVVAGAPLALEAASNSPASPRRPTSTTPSRRWSKRRRRRWAARRATPPRAGSATPPAVSTSTRCATSRTTSCSTARRTTTASTPASSSGRRPTPSPSSASTRTPSGPSTAATSVRSCRW